jgi:hypothetical protein
VYALISPDDGRVHYVGKTFKIADRFKQHVALARRRVGYGPQCAPTNRRERRLCDLARRDLEHILTILDGVPVADRGRDACGNSRDLISAAAEQGRKLALSLGESL